MFLKRLLLCVVSSSRPRASGASVRSAVSRERASKLPGPEVMCNPDDALVQPSGCGSGRNEPWLRLDASRCPMSPQVTLRWTVRSEQSHGLGFALGLRCCNASHQACSALPGSCEFAAVSSDISWKIHLLCVALCRERRDLVTASTQSLLTFECRGGQSLNRALCGVLTP